jgi:predicted metal-dependent hydrolase
MATAAVRIPLPSVSQLALDLPNSGPQIFVHEGTRQMLERRLELAVQGPVQLSVTDNRRRMVTQTKHLGTLRVRLHMMFLDAPERVKDALVRYIAKGEREASQLVGDYIDSNCFRIRAERPVTQPLRTAGQVHELANMLERLDRRYFGGALGDDVLITWGRRSSPRGASRTTIKLGTYSATERLIRLHPVLDQRFVPRYFVEYILFHELLHHIVPPVKVGRITLLHPPEFTQRERAYPHYERAIAWENRNLDRLLRSKAV